MGGVPGPLSALNGLPRESAAYIWADYVEILCLVAEDRLFSRDDLLDVIRDMRDMNVDADIDGEDEPQSSRAEANDRERRRIDDYFAHLAVRSRAFGDAYPFAISDRFDYLTAPEPLSPLQELYVFLLLCSNLRYLQGHVQTLTKCFELLSRDVLAAILPVGAVAHLFGAKHEGRFSGSFWDKLNSLASELREMVLVARDKVRGNNGDGGLDLVGWIPMGDDAQGFPVVFGQCACSKEDWPQKQHELDFDTWRKRLTLEVRPYNMLFVPFYLRTTSAGWERAFEVGNTVLVDRLRIVHFLRNTPELIQGRESFPILKAALAQRESAA